MNQAPRIAIITGEASGDLHGSLLAAEMLKKSADVELWGTGGGRMQDAGVDLIKRTAQSGAIGIAESVRTVPCLLHAYWRIRREMLRRKPGVVTLVDFSAFNRRVAKLARKHGIKTVYYFPPGAWRRRVKKSKDAGIADKFITPFPWSYEALKNGGADVTLIGHPLLDIVRPALSEEQFRERLGLLPGRVVAILPGSRTGEVQHIWPVMLRAVALIEDNVPGLQYVVAPAGPVQARVIEQTLSKMKADIRIAQGMTYDVLAHASLAITASGTATLEAAILNTPMVIAYRGSSFSHLEYLLRRKILEDHIGLPNIIAGKRICPELLSREASPTKMAELAIDLLQNPSKITEMKAELAKAVSALGNPGGAGTAAELILRTAGTSSIL